MKLLLLRGRVPIDRPRSEIKYSTIEECDDIYTLMAYHLADEVEVWYWGGDRVRKYGHMTERWIPNFKKVKSDFKPDVIWARGGFDEYRTVLKRYPDAFKIFYAAGRGSKHVPNDGIDYGLVLADTPVQLADIQDHGFNGALWTKPAAPMIKPKKTKKKYDICYIANAGQAKIKNLRWVYETAPRDLKILHLGFPNSLKVPKNVTQKRVLRSEIASEISKCKIGIIPYRKIDSAPRAMVEMMACGLQIVVMQGVKFWQDMYFPEKNMGHVTNMSTFWFRVKNVLEKGQVPDISKYYEEKLSMIPSANRLRGLIDGQGKCASTL